MGGGRDHGAHADQRVGRDGASVADPPQVMDEVSDHTPESRAEQ